tara:strand:+ start:41 stop:691 length:651 start_codon:yes stop_codon:yes gene_type:complete
MAKKRSRKTLNLEEVRRQANGRWGDILPAVTSVPAEKLTRRHGPCPQCGGKDRFNVYKDFSNTGGIRCNQCFTGKSADGFAAIQWLNNCDFPEAIRTVARHLGMRVPESTIRTPPKKNLDTSKEWTAEKMQRLRIWCLRKPITAEAMIAAGAKVGQHYKQHDVIVSNGGGGSVMHNLTGGGLPVFSGKGDKPEWVKVKTTSGSKAGVIANDAFHKN